MSEFSDLDHEHYNGVRFCKECNNILHPRVSLEESPHLLTFRCKNESCKGEEVSYINKSTLNQLLLFSKETRKSVVQHGSKDLVFDPTVPRENISCPKCGYFQAVFFLMPDSEERKLIKKYVCARVENYVSACGEVWQDVKA